jgi:hypothetical protein
METINAQWEKRNCCPFICIPEQALEVPIINPVRWVLRCGVDASTKILLSFKRLKRNNFDSRMSTPHANPPLQPLQLRE